MFRNKVNLYKTYRSVLKCVELIKHYKKIIVCEIINTQGCHSGYLLIHIFLIDYMLTHGFLPPGFVPHGFVPLGFLQPGFLTHYLLTLQIVCVIRRVHMLFFFCI